MEFSIKKSIFFIPAFALVSQFTFGGNGVGLEEKNNTVCFLENKGQVTDQNGKLRPDVLFSGTNGNMVYHIKKSGVSYQLYKSMAIVNRNTEKNIRPLEKTEEQQNIIYRIDVSWLNCNENVAIRTGKNLEKSNNYYLSHCANGISDVKSYNEIYYSNIYKGIDLKWYQKKNNLKYDYIVAAGADYKQIQLKIDGAEKVNVNRKGELIIKTPLGNITEQSPLVIQNKSILKSKWVVTNDVVSFEIENIDPKQSFVIDPVIRIWGTYYGGASSEVANSCITDKAGNIYLVGQTQSNLGTIIATSGAHQTIEAGLLDAFIVKFNSAGVRQWGTYIGGAKHDIAYGCALDTAGNNIYIAGRTESTDVNAIATGGAHQTTLGGNADGFLAKFNSSGVRQWGTYYGDITWDYAYSCATDAAGNVYMTGDAGNASGAIIATGGSHQSIFGGAFYDAYLVKFNSAGVRQWGTYYGGNQADYGRACVTDKAGNVYMAGITDSNTGTEIATGGSHQSVNGGFTDGFLVKFNTAGVRQWGTYYGGVTYDYVYSCCTDTTGNVFISGGTDAYTGTVIATTGAHQTVHAGGGDDGFLVKFNSSGVRQWGTYYGSSGVEAAGFCRADRKGNVYITGYTDTNAPSVFTTPDSHQTTFGGGFNANDAFFAKFNGAGVRQWGSYYGGTGNEGGTCIAIDTSCKYIYFSGYSDTNTGTVIATAGSHQSIQGGAIDAFLIKFFDCNTTNTPTVTAISSTGLLCLGNSATLTANGATTYSWSNSSTTSVTVISPTITTGYTVTGYANNGCPNTVAITQSVSACLGFSNLSVNENQITIYPNPANDIINISVASDKNENVKILVINNLGQLFYQEQIFTENDLIKLNASTWAQGLYHIKVITTTGTFTQKLTIIR